MSNCKISDGQFYITNVCNLTCDRCISFNNRKFKGHCQWATHESEYTEWSKKLDIDFITIIGGEPFTNPDLINWIHGLKKLWPNCKNKSVCTNGTYIKNNPQLVKEIIDNGFWLDICVHDPSQYEEIYKNLKSIFKNKFQTRSKIDNNSWVVEISNEIFLKNKKVAMLSKHYNFANMAVKKVENRITFMHDSNQEIAHNSCGPKYCHYFVNGSLYKCFLTAISNEIIDQFTIENRAVSILKKYKPCSPWDSQDNIEKYVTNLKFSIEQCKLCPEKTNIKPIWPLNLKKINF